MTVAPKEQAIFEAVLALMGEGRDLSGIRISEIAERAGIGKGTVYEYFPSRDDLMVGAILYHRQQKYESVRREMLAVESFHDRVEVGGKYMMQCLGHGTSALSFFPVRLLPESIRSRIFGNREVMERSFEMVDELSGYLLEAALKEELILTLPDQDWGRMVLTGCMAAFAQGIGQGQSPDRYSVVLLRTERMLLASLNAEILPEK